MPQIVFGNDLQTCRSLKSFSGTNCSRAEASNRFRERFAGVQKLQIVFGNELQTCRSPKSFSGTICRRAEAPNRFREPIADVRKPQIVFGNQLQTCRTGKHLHGMYGSSSAQMQKEGEDYLAAFRSTCSSAYDFSRAASPDTCVNAYIMVNIAFMAAIS